MDQLSASNFAMDSSALPTPSEGMASPPPNSPDHDAASGASDAAAFAAAARQHPIPPASEPMQYRAIGLVYGKYAPSEEQFTKGELTTEDGTVIDAVLLGRVMSLVKKHIDLEKPHLWVVYPRTREKQYDLHLQIMGIWEPENLAQDPSDQVDAASPATAAAASEPAITPPVESVETTTDEATEDPTEESIAAAAIAATDTATDDAEAEVTPEPDAESAADPSSVEDTGDTPVDSQTASATTAAEASTTVAESAAASSPADATAAASAEETAAKAGGAIAESTDGYFSIRGEVLFYAEEEENLVVRIQQSPKKEGKAAKAFKLTLTGKIEGKTVGYFWDLHVQRQGNRLVVQDGEMVAMVPPKKNKKKKRGAPNKTRRPNGARKPWKKEREEHEAKPAGEVQKPVKRPKRVMKPLGGE